MTALFDGHATTKGMPSPVPDTPAAGALQVTAVHYYSGWSGNQQCSAVNRKSSKYSKVKYNELITLVRAKSARKVPRQPRKPINTNSTMCLTAHGHGHTVMTSISFLFLTVSAACSPVPASVHECISTTSSTQPMCAVCCQV